MTFFPPHWPLHFTLLCWSCLLFPISPRAQSSGFFYLYSILWANSSNLMALNTIHKWRTPKFLSSTSPPSPNSRYTYLPPWCWERLKAGDGDDRGRDGRMAWPTQWTWIWASSRSWWWIGKPGMLQSTGSQRVGHVWVTEQSDIYYRFSVCDYYGVLL